MRDRMWIEFTCLFDAVRRQIDANKIQGEPIERYMRHTPPLDRSGELWMPGDYREAAT